METLKCESQSQMQLSPTHTEHPPLTNTVVWRVCTLRQMTHTHRHTLHTKLSLFRQIGCFFQTSLSNVAALNQKASWRNARSLALPPSLLFLPLISFPLRSCLRGVLRARQNRWGSGIKMMNAAHFGNEESSPQQMRRNGLQLCWKYNPRQKNNIQSASEQESDWGRESDWWGSMCTSLHLYSNLLVEKKEWAREPEREKRGETRE